MKLSKIAPSSSSDSGLIGRTDPVWLLNLDQIEPHTGELLSKQFVDFDAVGNSTIWFDETNVLYSKLRPYLNKVFLPDSKGLCTSELVPLKPNPQLITREYLAHYLRSKKFLQWVNEQIDGAKMPRVSMKAFWEHEISLPPIEEQKRIAAILDKADSLRRKRQQAIQLADDFLRAVFIDMFGDPATNSKNWPVGSIRDLVTSVNYGTSAKAYELQGEFPILRMNNITYTGRWDFTSLKYVDLSLSDQGKFMTKKGDLLFNRTNSKELVGKTAVFESDTAMAIAGYLIRVRVNERANPYYISAYLNSAYGKAILQAMSKSIVGMANINAQELQNIAIPIPPKQLQDKFEQLVTATRVREQKMIRGLDVLKNLQVSLVGQLM